MITSDCNGIRDSNGASSFTAKALRLDASLLLHRRYVTVMTSASVLSAPRSAEAAARVAVTTPVVLAAIAFKSAIEGLSLIVTVHQLHQPRCQP